MGWFHRRAIETSISVGSDAAATPAVASVARVQLRGLPVPATPLVGRQREQVSVAELLNQHRLVTLTGPGGIGKTRLAIASGHQAAEGEASLQVAFVDLAPLREPALVLPAVARALGIHESGGAALIELIRDHVASAAFLLVLDNVEHLLPGAAQFVSELLRTAPSLRILATSRAALDVYGEHQYPVPPLSLTSATDRDARYGEAVELFTQRAKSVRPDFDPSQADAAVIREICERLDGLPLAIELAAARLRLLPPRTLLAQLQHRLDAIARGAADLPERQRTLRATIDWSYSLMQPAERAWFDRLTAFVGGWTLEHADALGEGTRALPIGALQAIDELIRQSLVIRQEMDDPRFTMLETIREFGRDRLRASGEEQAVLAAHGHRFLAVAELAAGLVRGPAQAAAFATLEIDHPNLLAALGWAVAQEPHMAAKMATLLEPFWYTHGHLVLGRRWVEEAAAAADRTQSALPADEHAALLSAAADLAWAMGDFSASRAYLERSLRLRGGADDAVTRAELLTAMAFEASARGEWEAATAWWGESIDAARTSRPAIRAQAQLALLALEQGRAEDAAEQLDRLDHLTTEAGDPYIRAVYKWSLGQLCLRHGDRGTAAQLVSEALEFMISVNGSFGIAQCIRVVGEIAYEKGMRDQAVRLLLASDRLTEELGQRYPPVYLLARDRLARTLKSAVDPDLYERCSEEGRAMNQQAALDLARRSLLPPWPR